MFLIGTKFYDGSIILAKLLCMDEGVTVSEGS